MIEKLLTIKEVSEITGIAVKTLYVRGGGTKTLPRIKLGHSLRWRESDVRDWINRNVERPFDPRKAFKRSA